MKIVITTNKDSLDTEVSSRFGRCKYFGLVEVEDENIKEVECVENEGAKQAHGAGIKASEQVGNLGAEKIISGNIGPNASAVLNQLDIEVYKATGPVKKAISDLVSGELKKVESTVSKHFGM